MDKRPTDPLPPDFRLAGTPLLPFSKAFAVPKDGINVARLAFDTGLYEPLLSWAADLAFRAGLIALDPEMAERSKRRDRVHVRYVQGPCGFLITPLMFRERISKGDTQKIIDRVIANAERINSDPAFSSHVTHLYHFGSTMRGDGAAGDVDIGVESKWIRGSITYDEARAAWKSHNIFTNLRRGLSKHDVSLHEATEMNSIGAPNRLIWSAEKGRVSGKITTPAADPNAFSGDEPDAVERQRSADRATTYLRTKAAEMVPPPPPVTPPDSDRQTPLSHSSLRASLQDDGFRTGTAAVAHYHCLPAGPLKEAVGSYLDDRRKHVPGFVSRGEREVEQYLAASVAFNEWQWSEVKGLHRRPKAEIAAARAQWVAAQMQHQIVRGK